jgi:hypothetical protein
MQVVLLKSTKKAHGADPIQQCGGVILRDGETLAVRADLALSVRRAHPWLVEDGSEDVASLRCGVYEVRTGTKADASAPPKAEPQAETVQARASDRSMASVGKHKQKRK